MKSIQFNIGLSWLSQILYVAAQLIRVHILYKIFAESSRGTWFLMVSITGFVVFLELGFSGAFTRFYARSFGAESGENEAFLHERNIPRFSFQHLAENAKIIFSVLSVLAFGVTFFGGLFYLHTVDTFPLFSGGITLSWLFFSLSQGFLMRSFQYSSVLQGRRFVGLDSMVKTGGIILSTLLVLPAVFFRASLVYVSFVELLRGTATFYLLLYSCRRHVPEYVRIAPFFDKNIFKKLWKSSLIPFLAGIGASFFYNTDSFYIASLINVGIVSDYYNTQQIIAQLFGFCISMTSSAFPTLLSIFGTGNMDEFRALYGKTIRYSVMLYAFFGIYILFSGKYIVTLWLGHGHFVGYPILISLLVFYFFELQTAIFINAQFSMEKYPMIWAFWVSAILRYAFTLIFFDSFHLHLLAVIFGKIAAQLLTIGWVGAYFFLKTVNAWPLNFSRFRTALAIYSPIAIFGILGYATRFTSTQVWQGLIFQSFAYMSLAALAAYFLIGKAMRDNMFFRFKRFLALSLPR